MNRIVIHSNGLTEKLVNHPPEGVLVQYQESIIESRLELKEKINVTGEKTHLLGLT